MARPVGTKYIKTPEELCDLFLEYQKETKGNPILKHVFVGKDGDSEMEKRERPLTIEGFRNFCRRKICEVRQYLENDDNSYADYLGVCRAIKEEIRQDQIEGGMAMIYNPSITQRLNGLVEKAETKTEHSGTINANFGNVVQSSSKSGQDSQGN